MAQFTLKARSEIGKFGMVTVYGPDKSTILRQFRITQSEVDAVNATARDFPAGVTQKEWESSFVVMTGGHIDTGAVVENPDGTIYIKFGETTGPQNELVEVFMKLARAEYTGDVRTGITVAKATLDAKRPGVFDSITNNVVVTK
jgi:hypothetical protein